MPRSNCLPSIGPVTHEDSRITTTTCQHATSKSNVQLAKLASNRRQKKHKLQDIIYVLRKCVLCIWYRPEPSKIRAISNSARTQEFHSFKNYTLIPPGKKRGSLHYATDSYRFATSLLLVNYTLRTAFKQIFETLDIIYNSTGMCGREQCKSEMRDIHVSGKLHIRSLCKQLNSKVCCYKILFEQVYTMSQLVHNFM